MKKVLVVLMIFAVSSFGSMVFAGDEKADVDRPVVFGNAEVYGKARLSVDVIDTNSKTTGADTDLTKVSSNSSRLGFKGSEDLSDGLKAVFQVELLVSMDGSTTTVATGATNTTTGAVSSTGVNNLSFRNTYAGLSSKSLGAVIFGIHDTPYKVATGTLDIFADSLGDYNAIIGSVNGKTSFDMRSKDIVAYRSPSLGGVTVSAMTMLTGQESNNGTAGNASGYSAAVSYAGGPVFATLAYETHKNGLSDLDKAGKMKNAGAKLGAGLSFGDTKIGLIFENIKDETSNSAISRDAIYASVSHKIGKETIKLAYGMADDGKDPNSKTGASHITVGVDHAFSKRTSLYVLYTAMKNEADATYGIGTSGGGGSHVPGAGEDPSAFSIGVNHDF